jgi:hypothetical protein
MNLPLFRAEKMPATMPIAASMANEVSPSFRVMGKRSETISEMARPLYVSPRSPVKTPLM